MTPTSRQNAYPSDERPIRDLSDFCLRWPRLRPIVEGMLACSESEPAGGHSNKSAEAEIITWLCLLADRICVDPNP